jgi:hypothetical protein
LEVCISAPVHIGGNFEEGGELVAPLRPGSGLEHEVFKAVM